jgi:cytidyltransferase-like protein
MPPKKVFVSGCFDMLHSGHVRFLEEAATYGEVHIGLGSDRTVRELKGRAPVNTQAERQYMLEALRHVKSCRVNRGSGVLDFLAELDQLAPEIFVVNADGNSPAKAELCRERGIQYVVLQRTPSAGLPVRSTTSLRKECRIPYRLDLAGGWLDQPFVSQLAAGPVLTISLEPIIEFNERSGMASSSRRRAIELWQTDLPDGDLEKQAKMLFAFENPPGTKIFAGSQDAIGIVYPGLNRLDYAGEHWPVTITTETDETILRWLEQHLHLVPLRPRTDDYDVFKNRDLVAPKAAALATAATACWDAIRQRNLPEFGRRLRESFEAQVALFPEMSSPAIQQMITQYAPQALGWKLSGAGGGGYLVLVADQPLEGTLKLTIRRKMF